ncbi:hypothetical protein ACFT54_09860 [Streptomyces cinereoruber]|uniref:hypothetical protein n=1 Tax=Streptomyces cinereoruber TaxID=67260 RepID=UPI00363DFA92
MTLLLDRVVGLSSGADDEDLNAPWLPKIPRPRPAERPVKIPAKVPEQPTGSAGPSCCGRPMRRDGGQFVCGRCGGWSDPGVALVAAGPVAGQACGTCSGNGGKEVDTSSGGVTRKSWQTCSTCRGTGVR